MTGKKWRDRVGHTPRCWLLMPVSRLKNPATLCDIWLKFSIKLGFSLPISLFSVPVRRLSGQVSKKDFTDWLQQLLMKQREGGLTNGGEEVALSRGGKEEKLDEPAEKHPKESSSSHWTDLRETKDETFCAQRQMWIFTKNKQNLLKQRPKLNIYSA